MAGFNMLFYLVVLTAACASTTTTSSAPGPAAWRSLAGLLDGEGSQQCWETLMEIKSCTGEIILFFLNGEAYLGPGCCRAIRVIERRCWAADAMLAVIGFTPQEGDMLKGYCDAGEGDNNGQGQQGASPPPRSAADAGDAAAVARESVFGSVAAGRKQGPVHG
jgi:hypothetical protein